MSSPACMQTFMNRLCSNLVWWFISGSGLWEGKHFWLAGLMNLMLFLSHVINIKGREFLVIFVKRKSLFAFLIQNLQTVFFQTGVMMDTDKLYTFIPVWLTLTFNAGHSYNYEKQKKKKKKKEVPDWIEFSMPTWPVGLLKLMLNSFCTSNIQGRVSDFVKYAFNIGLRSDAYELISFKLDIMLDITKLSTLIPVWMRLTSTQGHRAITNLELVLLFCYSQSFSSGWLHKVDNRKEVL